MYCKETGEMIECIDIVGKKIVYHELAQRLDYIRTNVPMDDPIVLLEAIDGAIVIKIIGLKHRESEGQDIPQELEKMIEEAVEKKIDKAKKVEGKKANIYT